MKDFPGYYKHRDFPGQALVVKGYVQTWVEDTYWDTDADGNEREIPSGEHTWVDDTSAVYVVMVGDNHRYRVDPSDLVRIENDGFCGDCGATDCSHGR